jgi:hypothetical protein
LQIPRSQVVFELRRSRRSKCRCFVRCDSGNARLAATRAPRCLSAHTCTYTVQIDACGARRRSRLCAMHAGTGAQPGLEAQRVGRDGHDGLRSAVPGRWLAAHRPNRGRGPVEQAWPFGMHRICLAARIRPNPAGERHTVWIFTRTGLCEPDPTAHHASCEPAGQPTAVPTRSVTCAKERCTPPRKRTHIPGPTRASEPQKKRKERLERELGSHNACASCRDIHNSWDCCAAQPTSHAAPPAKSVRGEGDKPQKCRL